MKKPTIKLPTFEDLEKQKMVPKNPKLLRFLIFYLNDPNCCKKELSEICEVSHGTIKQWIDKIQSGQIDKLVLSGRRYIGEATEVVAVRASKFIVEKIKENAKSRNMNLSSYLQSRLPDWLHMDEVLGEDEHKL